MARDRNHDQLHEGGANHDRRFVAGEDCDHNHGVHGEMGGLGYSDLDLEQKGLGQALSSGDSLRFGHVRCTCRPMGQPTMVFKNHVFFNMFSVKIVWV